MQADHRKLKDFATHALLKLGLSEENSTITADVLVESNLRGTDTHGIVKLPQYAGIIKKGGLNPEADVEIVSDRNIMGIMDAQYGLGFAPTVKAMHWAIEKAKQWGMGIVGIKNSGHFGPAAYYPLIAQQNDMLGFLTTNTRVLLPAPGGAEAVIGNNPFAFAAPAGEELPFVFDMACSVQNFAIIRILEKKGEQMPPGWGFDNKGIPTVNPQDMLTGGGFMAPVGSHKGFGLAVMMDILSGVLTGASFGKTAGSLSEPGTSGCGHLLAALNIEWFIPIESFKSRIDDLIRSIKSSKTAPGVESVRLPGERGFLEKEIRMTQGIPIIDEVYNELKKLAEDLQIEIDIML